MFPKTLSKAVVFALGLLASGGTAAYAQTFPTRPVTFVSPWNPGGANDLIARALAPEVERILGQPVVVVNRPGASGTIGSASVATADDRGYSLVLGSTPTHATSPHVYANLPYDPATDFAPVTLVGISPNVLVVRADLAVDSVEELIAYALENPGELNYYSTGQGTSTHLSAELFKSMAGVDIEHVPYTGSAPGLVDLLAGRIDLAFDNASTVYPHIEAGTLKALGVTTSQRSDALPDVPTIAEAGVEGYDASVWFGFFAAPNAPAENLSILQSAIVDALAVPGTEGALRDLGIQVSTNTPEEFSEFLHAEIERWGELARAVGIERQ